MAKFEKSKRDLDEVYKKIENLDKKTSKKEENKVKKDKKNIKKKGFFREVIEEVKKVKFPEKKEMIKYSVATIVFILFFSGFFFAVQSLMALIKTLV